MKQVFVAQHPTEAHLVRGLLEAEGVPAEVHGEALFGVRGAAPADSGTLPSVWVVEDSDLSKAVAILTDYGRKAPHADPGTWLCPTCGLRVERQFTECWNCGASAP